MPYDLGVFCAAYFIVGAVGHHLIYQGGHIGATHFIASSSWCNSIVWLTFYWALVDAPMFGCTLSVSPDFVRCVLLDGVKAIWELGQGPSVAAVFFRLVLSLVPRLSNSCIVCSVSKDFMGVLPHHSHPSYRSCWCVSRSQA